MASTFLSLLLACLLSASSCEEKSSNETNSGGLGLSLDSISKGIQKEVADIKHPVEVAVTYIGSSQCQTVKRIAGVAYEQVVGEKEPDLNQLSLKFVTNAFTITYNIATAAREIPMARNFNPHQKLFIFIHGFTDDPSKASYSNISTALFSQGQYNVLALDGSSLIHWLYLRSTTYVRFMGEKLGEVLAAMVHSGVQPEQIHIIGHSLGSHISGFTGKTFKELTGQRVGRISGLDPAGPCFSHVDEELRLKHTDADYVDVIHTDGGVFGLSDPVGHADYYPNDGSQQPNCLYQTCSHSRAWVYYAESVISPRSFPAVQCNSWDDFKKGNCMNTISYMGFPSQPGTRGMYYLQTNGDQPYGLGLEGSKYKNTDGVVKTITNLFGETENILEDVVDGVSQTAHNIITTVNVIADIYKPIYQEKKRLISSIFGNSFLSEGQNSIFRQNPSDYNYYQMPIDIYQTEGSNYYNLPNSNNYQVPTIINYQIPNNIIYQTPNSNNYEIPNFNNYQIPNNIIYQTPNSKNYEISNFINYQIPNNIIYQTQNSNNYEIPNFNNYQIPNNIIYQTPNSKNYEISNFINYQIPNNIIYQTPNSNNYEIPNFNNYQIPNNIIYQTPNSNNYEISNFQNYQIPNNIIYQTPNYNNYEIPIVNKYIANLNIFRKPNYIDQKPSYTYHTPSFGYYQTPNFNFYQTPSSEHFDLT